MEGLQPDPTSVPHLPSGLAASICLSCAQQRAEQLNHGHGLEVGVPGPGRTEHLRL